MTKVLHAPSFWAGMGVAAGGLLILALYTGPIGLDLLIAVILASLFAVLVVAAVEVGR